MGDILAANADSAVAALQFEVSRIVEHPITPAVLAEAVRLVDRYVLRALDSIQLATAILSREGSQGSRQVLFVSSDKRLVVAAAAEGLSTWNPASGLPPP
jgi:predicted nucleic acid-binding protein